MPTGQKPDRNQIIVAWGRGTSTARARSPTITCPSGLTFGRGPDHIRCAASGRPPTILFSLASRIILRLLKLSLRHFWVWPMAIVSSPKISHSVNQLFDASIAERGRVMAQGSCSWPSASLGTYINACERACSFALVAWPVVSYGFVLFFLAS